MALLEIERHYHFFFSYAIHNAGRPVFVFFGVSVRKIFSPGVVFWRVMVGAGESD